MRYRFIQHAIQESRGISLIEILLYILILLIILSVGSGLISRQYPKYSLNNAAWKITSHLYFARYRAVFSGQKIKAVFANQKIILERYDEDQKKWDSLKTEYLEGVKVQANNTPIFHPKGTVSNLASIFVSNSSGMRKITIAISGRIKVLDL